MVIQVKQDWAQLLRFTLITGKLGGVLYGSEGYRNLATSPT